MRLATWWALRGRGGLAWLVEESGISYNTLHAIARGVRRPTADTAAAIQAATGGAVTITELLFPTEPEGSEPARANKRRKGQTKHGDKEAKQRKRQRARQAER